jgi:hypothetical protein
MSGDLRVLAEKYVTLTGEVEDVRRAMLACLTNGAGDAAITARPIKPAKKAGGSKTSHPHIKAAAEAEARILELIREQPLKTSEIAKATGAKVNTVTERMKRLRDKGMATSGDSGWRASA